MSKHKSHQTSSHPSSWKNRPTYDPAGEPDRGLFTWTVEGTEGGPNHSRGVSIPSGESGATTGRGYDATNRSVHDMTQDLIAARIGTAKLPAKDIAKELHRLTERSTLKTLDVRRQALKQGALGGFEITKQQQKDLFKRSYQQAEKTFERVCKYDRMQSIASVDLDKTDPEIKEMMIDLTFRGDFKKGDIQNKLQKAIATNKIEELRAILADKKLFLSVPPDRFNSRLDRLDEVLSFRKNNDELKRMRDAGQILRSEPAMTLDSILRGNPPDLRVSTARVHGPK